MIDRLNRKILGLILPILLVGVAGTGCQSMGPCSGYCYDYSELSCGNNCSGGNSTGHSCPGGSCSQGIKPMPEAKKKGSSSPYAHTKGELTLTRYQPKSQDKTPQVLPKVSPELPKVSPENLMQPNSSPVQMEPIPVPGGEVPQGNGGPNMGAQIMGPIPGHSGIPGPYGVEGPVTMNPGPIPTELAPASIPPYTVAPPDILLLDADRLLPRPPYRISPLEVLGIQVTETLPNQPILGKYTVSPEGTVNLGFAYGAVRVTGLTVEQAQEAIRKHLSDTLRNPQVVVALEQFRGIQQIRGEHLVRPDGTIHLGMYGSVYVAGLSLEQIKCVVEKHLSQYVAAPRISVDVFSYNSKKYYVIADGGGFGQLVFAFPYTGYETVLDAVSKINGLPAVSSKKKIWVARPSPCHSECNQVLPVDWNAITQGGSTCTNYQLLPGDRVYVRADALIAADNWLAKVLSPVERLFGITLLGSSTVNSIQNSGVGTGFIAAGF